MAIVADDNPQLTPKEHETMKYEERMWDKQADYNLQIARIETRWNALFRLPTLIIKLPIFFLFGIALICSMFTKKELPEAFWKYLS